LHIEIRVPEEAVDDSADNLVCGLLFEEKKKDVKRTSGGMSHHILLQ